MASPRRHEKAEGERDGQPIVGEEILGRGLAKGAWLLSLDEAIDDDSYRYYDWVRNYVLIGGVDTYFQSTT